ncbi:hypothetical protein SAMN05216374_1246 [Tardiphaga sp. OK246]|jgi:hypothetical protein|nr:hypothetical protein SAMN05216374_1246 [Tardiphaga sp. OK246]
MHDAQQMRGLRGSFCTKSVADPRVILSRRPCATPLTRSRRFAPSPTSPRRERGEVKRTRLTRSRTDSPVKQPRPAKREISSPPTRRPYRAFGAKRVDQFSPSSMRGMTRRKAQLGRSRVSLRPCEGPCDPRIAFRRAIAAFLFEGPRFRVLGRTNESPSFRSGFRPPSPAPVQPFPAEPRSGPGR